MRGDVAGFIALQTRERRVCRSIKKLERKLEKRRKYVAVDAPTVTATRPDDFSIDDLPYGCASQYKIITKRLISSKLCNGHHTFLVSHACERRALVIAPNADGTTMATLMTTLMGKAAHEPVASGVLLLRSESPLVGIPLFGRASALGAPQSVALKKYNIEGVIIFALCHADEHTLLPPAYFGLTAIHFKKLQQTAAWLLGMRMVSGWTV